MKTHTWRLQVLAILLVCCTIGWAECHAARDAVSVLCYHSFLGSGKFPYDISLPELASQMDFLADRGFRFVTYRDFSEGRVSGTKNVLVVIDDGNQSVYRAFREVFKPRNIRPLLAVYPGVIGKAPYALTWDQLAELVRDGCEIASHGYYHLPLDGKLYKADPEAFAREIRLSRETLRKRLGVEVTAFVYPGGVSSDAARNMLREEGYGCAFSLTWGQAIVPAGLNPDPYRLPRHMILGGNWDMVSSYLLRTSSLD